MKSRKRKNRPFVGVEGAVAYLRFISKLGFVYDETRNTGALLQQKKLGLETGATTTGRLHVRIVELEARSLERLDVIYFYTVKVEHAGLIDKNLQATEIIGLIEHSGRILESHGIRKAGAASPHNGNPEAGRLGLLRSQNLVNFYGRAFC